MKRLHKQAKAKVRVGLNELLPEEKVWFSKSGRFEITKLWWGLMLYHTDRDYPREYEKAGRGRIRIEIPLGSFCWNAIRRNCSYFKTRKFLTLLNGWTKDVHIGPLWIWSFIYALTPNDKGYCRRWGIRICNRDGLHTVGLTLRFKSKRENFN